MGIETELVLADYTGQWTGLGSGDLDVAMEVWHTFSAPAHDEWVTEKKRSPGSPKWVWWEQSTRSLYRIVSVRIDTVRCS